MSLVQVCNAVPKIHTIPRIRLIAIVASNVLEGSLPSDVVVVVHEELIIDRIVRGAGVSEAALDEIVASFPLTDSNVKVCSARTWRGSLSGTSHLGVSRLVRDFHHLVVVGSFAEHEVEAFVSVDWVGALQTIGFRPDVAK
jgi:hypothetical protein